jgi:hypothetical protein
LYDLATLLLSPFYAINFLEKETDPTRKPARILGRVQIRENEALNGKPSNAQALWPNRASDKVKREVALEKRTHTKGRRRVVLFIFSCPYSPPPGEGEFLGFPFLDVYSSVDNSS